jgi:hypothetical protein
MEKSFPCQEKVLLIFQKGKRILKNPLRKTIFPMNLNRDSEAHGILYLESCPAGESVLGADKSIKKVASFHHFLVALVVSLGNLKAGPDVLKVRSKDDDLHFPFFSCLPRPDADSFARAGDYGGLGWERHDEFKDGLLILIPSRPHYSDFHFAPSQKIEGRPQ